MSIALNTGRAVRPSRVSLRALPPAPSGTDIMLGSVPYEVRRARDFLEANPSAEYAWASIRHSDLARLDRSDVLVGSTDHPPSHRWNSHRFADIDGPGPHSLVFRRSWPRYTVSGRFGCRRVNYPGALIVPNFTFDAATQCDLLDELGSAHWAAWEAAAKSGTSALN